MTQFNAVIVGAGPAGLFAAYEMQRLGIDKILLADMGKDMKLRFCPQSYLCDCKNCDILEGQGGAGGFSDGKNTYSLTRGTQLEELFSQEHSVILKFIDDMIVRYGVEGRSYDQVIEKPQEFEASPFRFGSYPLRHIGSDGVRDFIVRFTEEIARGGAVITYGEEALEINFDGARATGIRFRDRHGSEMDVSGKNVLIATGLQGVPWLESQMKARNILMNRGPAGMGIRVEAAQEVLASLFDKFYDFKLEFDHSGMVYRSFCCNRNGYVINENHRTLGVRNVNGHSYLDKSKASKSSNFAIICKIGLDSDPFPQAMVRNMGRKINHLVDGGTVVQGLKDFIEKSVSQYIDSPYKTNPQARWAVDIRHGMSADVYEGFRKFLVELGAIVPDLITNKSLVYAPEIKYFGRKLPIDFNTWQCKDIPGLYILGNASGYLDSFVSAALTGVIAARGIKNREGGL